MILREYIKYMFWFFADPELYVISFVLWWGINIQNDDITPATS
jgi:hypothetical protein